MRTIEQMIQSEVLCCMSSMVSTLAMGRDTAPNKPRNLLELCEQAFELACSIPDYEEAATQAGWRIEEGKFGQNVFVARSEPDAGLISGANPNNACGWEDLCHKEHIDPYDREVFEHWAVTDWFADKLIEAGEKVDKDFAGLCIWARTTTGQQISADGVIERIYAQTHKEAA